MFAASMVENLCITRESMYDTFTEVAVIIFEEADPDHTHNENINWGKIITLFAFSSFCDLFFISTFSLQSQLASQGPPVTRASDYVKLRTVKPIISEIACLTFWAETEISFV